MRKFTGAVISLLLLAAILLGGASASHSDIDLEFLADIDIRTMNSNITTTDISFPEMNVTGYYLSKVLPGNFSKYIESGYYVYIYNITSHLRLMTTYTYGLPSGQTPVGHIDVAFIAFGNDTNNSSRQITINSKAIIYIGDWSTINSSAPGFSQLDGLGINGTDLRTFLTGYYFGVIVPTAVGYYKPGTIVNLPADFNNHTKIHIDCPWGRDPWYCGGTGAVPPSNLDFFGAFASNLNITIDKNSGHGYFVGTVQMAYKANFIQFIPDVQEPKNITLSGNATIIITGDVFPVGPNFSKIALSSDFSLSVPYDNTGTHFMDNAANAIFREHYLVSFTEFLEKYTFNF